MRRFNNFQPLLLLTLFLGISVLPAWAMDDDYHLDVWPHKSKIVVGQQVQFQAQLKDPQGNVVQAQFQWRLKKGENVGTLSDSGLFTARNPGDAEIEATAMGFSIHEDAEVEVVSPGDPTGHHHNREQGSSSMMGDLILRLMPGKAEVALNQTFQFQVLVTRLDGSAVDTTVVWAVQDTTIGMIDDQGLFTAKAYGETYVMASVGMLSVRAKVEVEDEEEHHFAGGGEFRIIVNPRKVELQLGDTYQFMASVTDSNGAPVDTTVVWSLEGWPIGAIDSTGLFTAQAYGEAYVIASVGSSFGRAKVEVEGHGRHHGRHHHHAGPMGLQLNLSPQDTAVYVGDAVQFQARLVDSSGMAVNATFVWELEGDKSIGTLDQNGYFRSQNPGLGFVEVKAGEWKAKTSIQVMSRSDSTGQLNQMMIQRLLPNGTLIDDSVVVKEGEVFKLEDFPYPFDILNGGLLTLPDGALHEDILLTISLSELAVVDSDSVYYDPSVLAAIQFEVSVNGAVVHPYYFDKPLRLSLPYQPDILRQRGINPDSLDIAYFLHQDLFERVGIANVVIDTMQNRVFAEVQHFSTIVIISRSTITAVQKGQLAPREMTLFQNYPNPFNPETTIRFQLPAQAYVEVKVFNILGAEVKSLFVGIKPAGIHSVRWDGTDNFFRKVTSGIYFYQVKSGSHVSTKRMILLK